MYFIINLSGSQQFSGSSIQNQVELSEWATGRFMHWPPLTYREWFGLPKGFISSKLIIRTSNKAGLDTGWDLLQSTHMSMIGNCALWHCSMNTYVVQKTLEGIIVKFLLQVLNLTQPSQETLCHAGWKPFLEQQEWTWLSLLLAAPGLLPAAKPVRKEFLYRRLWMQLGGRDPLPSRNGTKRRLDLIVIGWLIVY